MVLEEGDETDFGNSDEVPEYNYCAPWPPLSVLRFACQPISGTFRARDGEAASLCHPPTLDHFQRISVLSRILPSGRM